VGFIPELLQECLKPPEERERRRVEKVEKGGIRGTRLYEKESASELYRPSDRCLSARLVPAFAERGCHIISVTDPYGRIL
jgi:hypothetical protein